MATSVTRSHIFGQKRVGAAGIAVALETTQYLISALMLIAHSDNAGRIFYGGSDVDRATQKGLAPGEAIVFQTINEEPFDLAEIFIDAAVSNDAVDFVTTRARRGSN